jgi:FkbM family methyltransferase
MLKVLSFSPIDLSNMKLHRRLLIKLSVPIAKISRKIWLRSCWSKWSLHELSNLWKNVWIINRYVSCLPRNKSMIILTKMENGTLINLNLARLTDSFAYCFDVGESEIGYFCKRFCKTDFIVLDVGANIGTTTLFFAKFFNKGLVYSYEPSSEIRKYLKENVHLNGFPNVVIEPFALSKSPDKGYIKVDMIYNPGSGHVSKDRRGEAIDITTIDINHQRKKRIDLIKIDVEGYEMNVLLGGKKRINEYKPIMIIEINNETLNNYKYNVSDIFNLLNDWSYDIYLLENGYPVKISEALKKNKGIYNIIAIHKKTEFNFCVE